MSKILIVSADFNLATVMKARLGMEGYETLEAADGFLGFESARKSIPDLIVLDAALPRMSGYQLIEKLKESGKELRRVPVIVIADRPQDEYLFRKSDIVHFFPKPVRPVPFLKQVALALRSGSMPQGPEKKDLAGKKGRVLLAGVQEFVLRKLQQFFEKEGFQVDMGWDETDLIQKARAQKPDYIFIQFWEEFSTFNAPEVMAQLEQDTALRSVSRFIFCNENIVRDALSLFSHQRIISYYKTQDLLAAVAEILRGPGAKDPGRPFS